MAVREKPQGAPWTQRALTSTAPPPPPQTAQPPSPQSPPEPSPDVRELIMRALSTLLESPGCIAAMERHPAAIESLVPRLMGSFSGEHWQEVALAMLRLIGGAGMGELVELLAPEGDKPEAPGGSVSGSGRGPPPARSSGSAADWRSRLMPAQRADSAGAALTVVEAVAAHVGRSGAALDSLDGGGPAGRPSSGSDLFRASFGAYASSNLEAAARFLGQLYDSLNRWAEPGRLAAPGGAPGWAAGARATAPCSAGRRCCL
jgi:hypothetical protein